MAGSGFKTFSVGEVLTAANVQNYLMDQAVMRFADSGARGSAIGTATEGMVSYLDDTDAVEVYDGSSWVAVAPTDNLVPYANRVTTTTDQTVTAVFGTFVAVTGATLTVTPQSTSSKFLILFSFTGESSGVTTAYFRFMVDSGGGPAPMTNPYRITVDNTYRAMATKAYIAEPATTGSRTFSVQTSRSGGTSFTIEDSQFSVIEFSL